MLSSEWRVREFDLISEEEAEVGADPPRLRVPTKAGGPAAEQLMMGLAGGGAGKRPWG